MSNVNETIEMTVITRIEEITIEINSKLDVIQKESISVGELLIEAKEEMKESDKSYADFVQYCLVSFNIGKAQASKLMKVARVFKYNTRFKGVAMRVLYTLASQATDEQIERAAVFAETGSLDSGVLNQLLNPKPVEKPQVDKPIESPESVKEKEDAIQQAIDSVPEREEVSQRETTEELPEVSEALSEIQELKSALQAANDLIKQFRESQTTHNVSKDMPMLPQFTNACPYAVLGLGQIESQKVNTVKRAFRELIKCGYGNGHEAFELLTKAKDSLLESIKASK